MKKALKTYASVAIMAAETMPPKMAVQVIAEIMTVYQNRLKELELRVMILESRVKPKAKATRKAGPRLGKMGKLTTDRIMHQIRKDSR